MLSVPGYEAVESLNEGRQFTVYRARRSADGAVVALKCIAGADPDGGLAAQLRR